MEYKDDHFKFDWIDNFTIKTSIEKNTIVIKANKAGLLSLSQMFIAMASENTPAGFHIHLDDYNSLEENSVEIIFEKLK